MADTQSQSQPAPKTGNDPLAQLQALLQQMMDQNKPVDKVDLQGKADVKTPDSKDNNKDEAKPLANIDTAAKITSPSDVVTNAILNQGQLIKTSSASGSNTGTQGTLQSVINTINTLSSKVDQSTAAGKKDSGGSDILGSVFKAATSFLKWIVCTELVRQGKMPKEWWIKGGSVFAAYPEAVKEGYYLWAIPSVKHLRKHPNSMYSKLLENVFYWRAQNIAEKRNYKGMMVTVILWPICYILGIFVFIFRGNLDWKAVYKNG